MTQLTEAELRAVQEIIANTHPPEIHYYEISASRLEGEVADDSGQPARDNLTFNLEFRRAQYGFGLRITAEVVLPFGRAKASVSGEYALPDHFEPTDAACHLFCNEVAVMAIYPYLREALATTTGRVFSGQMVQLPVMERGTLCLPIEGQEAGPTPDETGTRRTLDYSDMMIIQDALSVYRMLLEQTDDTANPHYARTATLLADLVNVFDEPGRKAPKNAPRLPYSDYRVLRSALAAYGKAVELLADQFDDEFDVVASEARRERAQELRNDVASAFEDYDDDDLYDDHEGLELEDED